MNTEIELSIAANQISRKSDMTIISELAFINRCIKTNERDVFLSLIFLKQCEDNINDNDIFTIKESLRIVQSLLLNEWNKRHSN